MKLYIARGHVYDNTPGVVFIFIGTCPPTRKKLDGYAVYSFEQNENCRLLWSGNVHQEKEGYQTKSADINISFFSGLDHLKNNTVIEYQLW